MTVQEWLGRAALVDVRVNAKIEEIERLEACAQHATGGTTARMLSGTSRKSKLEYNMCEVVLLQEDLKNEIRTLLQLKRQIYDVLRKLDNPVFQLILELRYVQFKKWHEVCDLTGFDERYMYRLHNRALKQIGKHITELELQAG